MWGALAHTGYVYRLDKNPKKAQRVKAETGMLLWKVPATGLGAMVTGHCGGRSGPSPHPSPLGEFLSLQTIAQ